MSGPILSVSSTPRAAVGPSRCLQLTSSQPPQTVVALLETSGSASDRSLAQMLVRARQAFSAYLAQGAVLNVCAGGDNGNGGEPILVLLSPRFDRRRPATVHTHYHGNDASVCEAVDHPRGFTRRLVDRQARDPQLVFVLPECANPPPSERDFDCDWSKVTSQRQAARVALQGAGVEPPYAELVVSGHSRAYRALAQAARADHGAGLQCDRLELLDCLYADLAEVLAQWARSAAGGRCMRVVYIRATNEEEKAKPLVAAFGDRYAYRNIGVDADGHWRARALIHAT